MGRSHATLRCHVDPCRLPALARYVAAQRVSLLSIAERVDEAEAAWASDDLPTSAADCLDLAVVFPAPCSASELVHSRGTRTGRKRSLPASPWSRGFASGRRQNGKETRRPSSNGSRKTGEPLLELRGNNTNARRR